jgi:hypothetical protein
MTAAADQDERYFELLDQGYAPPDAAMMTRTRRFNGPSPRWHGSRIPAERREPEPLDFSAPSPEEIADARRNAAVAAVRWATTWRTWPSNGDQEAALQAALAAVNRNPTISKFELAKIAANAASSDRPARRRKRAA